MKKVFLFLCTSLSLFGVQITLLEKTAEIEGSSIMLNPSLNGSNVVAFPMNMTMKVTGFPLGIISQFERKNQFRGDPQGQAIHLFIDDLPYVDISHLSGSLASYTIKTPLLRGKHLVRVLLCRSFGECLKGKGGFSMASFSVSDRKDRIPLEFNQAAPLLTYNEPQGTFDRGAILLDFYLSNCTLAPDGYKVILRIDNKKVKVIDAWAPYSISDLAKGPHKIRLTLIDAVGKEVSGEFNNVEREIFVK
ncbi:MAG: hypothetical protein KBC64_00070 [Simkaniaceae bacterium]|nr:hypothetical protein [Simkaniaceae bacterium]